MVIAAAAALPACRPAYAPSAPFIAPSAIHYKTRVASASPWILDVEATLTGGATALVSDVPEGVVSVAVVGGSGSGGKGEREVEPEEMSDSGRLAFPVNCRATCRVRYRYDLTRAIERSDDPIDEAVAGGDDILAPGYAWLLRPDPIAPEAPVTLVVETRPGVDFAAAFRPSKTSGASAASVASEREAGPGRRAFELRAEDLSSAGYTAFGAFTRLSAEATGATIDIAVLRGRRRADDALLARWIGATAKTLDSVFGRFPLDRAQLFVVPVRRSREVEKGKTLAAGGGSIALVIGAGAGEAELRGDWILTHELFHLGVPSFRREGRWLDEGLATYYEPVLRTRAGIRSDVELWTEFADGMPRGLAYAGEQSLLATDRHERLYWGGAMFALEADVLIRSRSRGTKSLDDGIRAALARGAEATAMWSLPAYLRVIDEGTGLTVLRELYEATAKRGFLDACGESGSFEFGLNKRAAKSEPDPCALSDRDVLRGLLRSLGVTRSASGSVELVDEAPLSPIRRTLCRGPQRAE
jgi:hypothetical protein